MIGLRAVTVKRGSRTVLTIPALDIKAGEVLAIVGPNGAGKSTLLHLLARLVKPSRGEISYQGRSIKQIGETAYRRRIGLVLQAPLLFDMTVYNNVASGLRFRGVGKQEIESRVARWLKRLGIPHLSDRRATDLSGGEAQRVSLARALILEPDLLLLDEPFSALDPPTIKRIRRELTDILAETKTTTLLITHDLEEAAQLGDRIGIIMEGELRQIGTPEEIYARPVDASVAAFIEG